MLSRRELARAARALAARVADGHVDRVVQRGARLELTLSGPPRAGDGRDRVLLVLSADARHARAGEARAFDAAPPAPPGFAQLLRARVNRARILAVSGSDAERELSLRLRAGGEERTLVLQLLGPRSNVYLLDATGRLEGALRPLAETRPELAIGLPLLPLASAPPAEGEDRFADVPDGELLLAIEDHYAEREREEAAGTLARRIGRALDRERQRLVRREAAVRADLSRARPSADLRRSGELLKGALHRVVPGAREVTIEDPETGQDVTVPLEPALPAARNLERLFASYQRARRREAAAAEQGAALESDLERLAALRESCEPALVADPPDLAALVRLAARPDVARLLGRHGRRESSRGAGRAAPGGSTRPTTRSGGEMPARLRPSRYRTQDGLEVWVGRSALGNDHLTTRLAKQNDLFLHVEGSPGSHVVLRLAGRKDSPQESLLEAAELALHFSKQRGGSRATIHVAAVGDVRKPRGAKPGLVHVQRGRTLPLRHEAERLARILGSRIEE